MKTNRTWVALSSLAAGMVLMSVAVHAGETVTYQGKGTYFATRALLPLASGGAGVIVTNDVVATIEPSDTGFLFGECAGVGYLPAEGQITSNVYCAFKETGEDSLDVHLAVEGDKAKVTVLGGSGKWAGATGSGTVARTFEASNRGGYTYEWTVKTP